MVGIIQLSLVIACMMMTQLNTADTTSSGGILSLGLAEVADANAGAVLKTFTDIIDDLTDALNADKGEDFSTLVCSIKNTMSDMGPVNPLFDRKLQAFREELIPTVIEKWDRLKMAHQH